MPQDTFLILPNSYTANFLYPPDEFLFRYPLDEFLFQNQETQNSKNIIKYCDDFHLLMIWVSNLQFSLPLFHLAHSSCWDYILRYLTFTWNLSLHYSFLSLVSERSIFIQLTNVYSVYHGSSLSLMINMTEKKDYVGDRLGMTNTGKITQESQHTLGLKWPELSLCQMFSHFLVL